MHHKSKNPHELPQIRPKNIVHKILERSGRISEPKWHYQELIMVRMGSKSCLRDIFVDNPNLMVTCLQIQLAKPLHHVIHLKAPE